VAVVDPRHHVPDVVHHALRVHAPRGAGGV